MSDQPKPATGTPCHVTGPSSRICEHGTKSCEVQHTKPTGEWTVAKVKDYIGVALDARLTTEAFKACDRLASAVNAALTAEREKYKIPGGIEVDPATIPQQPITEVEANVNRLENALEFADKTNSGLHRIITGHTDQIHQLEQQLAAEREKLAAAQSGNKAAKAFMDYLRANTGVSDEWPIELRVAEDSIDPINTLLNQFEQTIYATSTTALDAAIAAAQQPLVELLRGVHEWFMKQAPEHYNGCGLWIDVDATLKYFAKVKEGK